VIPAYNEAAIVEEAIASALSALSLSSISHEVVLVDDGSSDGTLAAMRRIEAQNSNVRVVAHEQNRGLGAALRTGFAACHGEVLTWIPGDGQFDLRQVLNGLPLMTDHDIVVALRKGVRQSWRVAITWCFHLLTWTLFRFKASDLCGIYIIRRAVLEQIHPQATNIFYNLEVPILCAKFRKRLAQITVSVLPRLGGTSKVANFRTLSRNLLEMIRIRFRRPR
jgi:glycosyltransferase involved in cell wall biosynthesis